MANKIVNPLSETQSKALEQLLDGAEPQQLIWLSGYFQGLTAAFRETAQADQRTQPAQRVTAGSVAMQPPDQKGVVRPQSITILYGSHTGRSEGVAKKMNRLLAEKSVSSTVSVSVFPMNDYNTRQLEKEKNLFVIVSTHGEGEPPEMAEDFHKFITGKRVSALPDLNFAVLALGDKSYKLFCQTGKEIDMALKAAGAKELLPLVACDVDYEEEANAWIETVINKLTSGYNLPLSGKNGFAQQENLMANSFVYPDIILTNGHIHNGFNGRRMADVVPALATELTEVVETIEYDRKKPFRAVILDKAKITGRDSDKEVYHFEISLAGSGISYQPGDSLGILADNPPELVEKLIQKSHLNPDTAVTLKKSEMDLRTALSHHLEITILTRDVIQKYYQKTGSDAIRKILDDDVLLDSYLWGNDILDLIEEFPFPLTASELVDMLRPLPPRLYSISSSQEAVGDEVHITVSTVRYQNKGRKREGACSTFLADRIEVEQEIPVYIERNREFRLPSNENTPIIMVGAGTGIAPFRAFMQHREAGKLKGKSWLFFGERHFFSDFLYQVEWQGFLKRGYLEKIDLAFSRDQEEKVYVQHRLAEQQAEVFRWLEGGASFYLCGDMKHMAKDVQKTLLEIIRVQGGLSEEQALEYFRKLKKEKRFRADVY